MIDARPPEAETRAGVGHWEGDLVNGAAGTGHLATVVERRTRFTLVGRTSTNENVNGLIRRLHPKKSSFADIGEAELRRIDRYLLNDRPRKCPGWRTPREVMSAFLESAP